MVILKYRSALNDEMETFDSLKISSFVNFVHSFDVIIKQAHDFFSGSEKKVNIEIHFFFKLRNG